MSVLVWCKFEKHPDTIYSQLCVLCMSESSEGQCVDMTAVLLINQDNTSTGHTL